MAEPTVKAEPGSPAYVDDLSHDDDVYEETGDLEFSNRNTDSQTNMNDKMFLVRLPKYLWESWDKLEEDEPIQIGTIRKWETEHSKWVGQGMNRHMQLEKLNHFKMLLFDRPEHKAIPKEYDLEVTDMTVNNTFLFTEQDLASHRLKNKIKTEQQKAGIPQNLIRASWASQNETQPDENTNNHTTGYRYDRRDRRYIPYRKAVPKKTVLYGRFRHELNCAPVDNEEARQLLRDRVREATEPKRRIEVMSIADSASKTVLQSGSGAALDKFSTFIVSPTVPERLDETSNWPYRAKKSTQKPATKSKKQESKATRVSEGELRDMLNTCFKKYSYWSMKALRQETQQPEAYLRENLELIADLHKSGTFANLWSLKDEFKTSSQLVPGQSEVAPDAHIMDGDVSEFEGDDDGDKKMED